MDLYSIKSIHELLSKHGFRFSKSLGQNFLTDSSVCRDIAVYSELSDRDCVLEIGPGIGSLTVQLSEHAGKVISVEIDRALLPVLNETIGHLNNVKIINADILKCDLEKLISSESCGLTPKVCANLPYYITTPVLSRLIESKLFCTIATMVQKEVADRICAAPATPDYGAFSVFVQYYTEPVRILDVPSTCFEPRPKVDSAVVMLKAREAPLVSPLSEAFFFRVVKASFAQRRKQLVNGLFSAFGAKIAKEDIISVLTSLGHSSTVRGETLGIPEFGAISDKLWLAVLGAKGDNY